jgi:N-acetylated-alpha-linked acidic dipeptidase
MDMPVYPGDPQTPGIGAVANAKLIPLDQVQTITKIPVLPISYADATPFLKALRGELVPESWRGGLPFAYKVGPSIAMAHLAVSFNWDRKPLYNVVATIPGSTFPDQWVIRGYHHDAWVNGAGDPISGASAQLEEARGLGELLKQGWHPQRTIIYCFWDGEEPALLGSTEWVETHAAELSQHAVAYFNSDGNGRGYFRAEGSSELENFVNSVTKDIDDPETKMPVWKRQRLVALSRATADGKAELRNRPDIAWRPSVPDRITLLLFTTLESPASTLAMAGKIKAAVNIILSTTISTGTRTFKIPISSTDAPLPRQLER